MKKIKTEPPDGEIIQVTVPGKWCASVIIVPFEIALAVKPDSIWGAPSQYSVEMQYQSKVWTHLLIPGFFFIFTILYILE